MEGSFQSRLDQVFGGLSAPASSVSLNSSKASNFWSVSGEQLERRQWRRAENSEEDEDDDEQQPCSLSQAGAEQASKRARSENGEEEMEDELMEVREMVGMDSTLDFEDEEDEYDKVAVGREGAGDRLYTSDVKAGLDNLSVLPNTFREGRSMGRDDRASRKAAADRLAEDAKEAQENGSAALFKKLRQGGNATTCMKRRKEHDSAENGGHSEKRVRFDVQEPAPETKAVRKDHGVGKDRYQNVPHHVRHPEKYTHYTLDWSEETGSDNNVKAWAATMASVAASKNELQNEPVELPQHVQFVPRSTGAKKEKDSVMAETKPTAGSVTIAASAEMEDGNGAEFNPESRSGSVAGRRSYRSRRSDVED